MFAFIHAAEVTLFASSCANSFGVKRPFPPLAFLSAYICLFFSAELGILLAEASPTKHYLLPPPPKRPPDVKTLTSSHLISPHSYAHLTSPHLISSHRTSSHLISSHLICYLISSHCISSHISPRLVSSHLTSYFIAPHLTAVCRVLV